MSKLHPNNDPNDASDDDSYNGSCFEVEEEEIEDEEVCLIYKMFKIIFVHWIICHV